MFGAFGVAAIISSCHFPYQPKPFVLPEWPVSPYVFPSSAAIDSFFNTTNVKIAYALADNVFRTVYFIDFNAATPAPVKLIKPAGMENIDADSPLISPDGTFVTYYLITGNTTYGAYIQKLDPDAQPVLVASNGTEPHWWKDSANQVYVIYSDQYMVENLVTGVGHTFRQKFSPNGNGSLLGAVDTIAPYPMNGGLSKDGRYLCTGYKHAAFYDISTQTLVPINGDNQVCNPSTDPDSSLPYRMMFLNIGGIQSLNNPFLGNADFPSNNLSQHAYLFIVDPSNTVQDYVPITIMGNSYHAWQCPEWSNNPNFAAAMALADEFATTGDGVIIKGMENRMAQKKILVFTQGSGKLNTQRATPYVWIGN